MEMATAHWLARRVEGDDHEAGEPLVGQWCGRASLSEEEHVPRHESDVTWTHVGSPNS